MVGSTTEIWRRHSRRHWAWRQHSEEATKLPSSSFPVLSLSPSAFTPLLTSSSSSSSSTSWPSSLTPSSFSPSTSSTWLVGVASLTGVELLGAESSGALRIFPKGAFPINIHIFLLINPISFTCRGRAMGILPRSGAFLRLEGDEADWPRWETLLGTWTRRIPSFTSNKPRNCLPTLIHAFNCHQYLEWPSLVFFPDYFGGLASSPVFRLLVPGHWTSQSFVREETIINRGWID